MKSFQFILIALVILAFPFSCSKPEQRSSTADSQQEVLKRSEAYVEAVKTVNAEKVLSFWLDDLKVISTGSDIVGKEAFREMLENFYKGLTIHALEVKSRTMDISGDLAVETAEYFEIMSVNGGEKQNVHGKQVTIWKKVDGLWKISKVAIIPLTKDVFHDTLNE